MRDKKLRSRIFSFFKVAIFLGTNAEYKNVEGKQEKMCIERWEMLTCEQICSHECYSLSKHSIHAMIKLLKVCKRDDPFFLFS